MNTEQDHFVFPNFYIFHNETGWHWVSRDATQSSPAAFDFLLACLKDASTKLNRTPK